LPQAAGSSANRFSTAKADELSDTPFTLVTDKQTAEAALTAISQFSTLGADTETTGLDPFRSRVRLLQIATPEHAFVFDLFAYPAMADAPLRQWFADPHVTKIFHNAKFDLKMLLHHFEVEVRGAFDTLLASQLSAAGRGEERQ
jgi:ribonuclease D